MNRKARAFTLIELMISIALVLLLILGVNQVFTYTTQAVGAGEAINSAIRLSRAAQSQFAKDFAGLVPNGGGPNNAACIIISSRAYYAFSSAKDQATDKDAIPSTIDLNGDGTEGDTNVIGENIYPSTYNLRNHRLDVLSFFARGLFHRQTGNPGTFVDDLTSQEAWIWYGHLHLPDNNGNDPAGDFPNTSPTQSTFPCMGSSATNPNNYFGSKLVLGRMAMLLKPATAGALYDNAGVSQWYIPSNTAPGSCNPLTCGDIVNQFSQLESNGQQYVLPYSRVDVADTSIAQFKKNFVTPTPGWWDAMMDGNQTFSLKSQGHDNYTRFEGNAFVAKPMQSWNMAQASPYFMEGCSQFIVEFAGDFLTQDNDVTHTTRGGSPGHSMYGDVNGPGPDGQIDYVIVNGQKVISWYGMPRSISGSGSTILSANGDVAPLRDRFQVMYDAATGAPLPVPYAVLPIPPGSVAGLAALGYPTFEKYGPAYPTANNFDYSGQKGMSGPEANTGYTCAFGPNDPHPKLIRISITLDDPTGRLPDGQTYQYVYALP